MKITVNTKTGAVAISSDLNGTERREVGRRLLNVETFGDDTEWKHVARAGNKIMDAFAAAAMSRMEDFADLQAAMDTYGFRGMGMEVEGEKLAEVALHIPTALLERPRRKT